MYGDGDTICVLVHEFAGSGSALDCLPFLWSYRYLLKYICICVLLWVVDHLMIKHNFQRRMSRLEQGWRAQRSVISIVNCRIPWTNRDLNVYCAFGISLKARLLQCLLIFMPLTYSNLLVLSCVRVCVSKSFVPLTHSVHRCCPQQAIWITLLCHTLLCCWSLAWYNSNFLISFKTWS